MKTSKQREQEAIDKAMATFKGEIVSLPDEVERGQTHTKKVYNQQSEFFQSINDAKRIKKSGRVFNPERQREKYRAYYKAKEVERDSTLDRRWKKSRYTKKFEFTDKD